MASSAEVATEVNQEPSQPNNTDDSEASLDSSSSLSAQQWGFIQEQQQRLMNARQTRALAEACWHRLHEQREELDTKFNSSEPISDEKYDQERRELAANLKKALDVVATSMQEEKDAAEKLLQLGLAQNLIQGLLAQQQQQQQQQQSR